MGKTDSTGTYSYVCDGTTPGSPVLADGHALYTPGLSENRGGTSVYYDFDRLGNLWTADGTGKSQYAAVDYSAFGITLSGSAGSPFGYGGANGCLTDLDASLVLMGHRYFDPRTGRFISQDPAGSGNNWYAYCGNNPVNGIDPEGLDPSFTQSPADVQADLQTLYNNPFYTDDSEINYDSNGSPYFTGTNGHVYGASQVHLGGGGDSNPGLFDGVGGAAMVGISAVASQASFGLYNGGAARHDPSFGVSSAFAGLGVTALSIVVPGGGEAKAAGELEELTALWHDGGEVDSAANLAKHSFGHKGQMNANNLLQYARKAAGHLPQAKKGATKSIVEGVTEGVVRYRKNGVYMDLAPDGRIISFGR